MAQRTIEERIKDIQRELGLRPDGILGPVTLSTLEHRLGCSLDPSTCNLVVSDDSLDLILRFEISSFANYERNLSRPTWPGAESGVTVGIGYDLGHNTALQIERDWRGQIADDELGDLLTVAEITGTAARDRVDDLQHIEVPLDAAREVFYVATLPRYANDTRHVFEGIEALPADAQGALLSLVFNRGASMRDIDSRREMRAIRPLVVAGDLPGIAEQIRSMKRLWDIDTLRGLHRRRDEEAELVEGAQRHYELAELVRL